MPEASENKLCVCFVYHEFDKGIKDQLKEHLQESLPSGFFLWDRYAGVTAEQELSYIRRAVVLLVLVSIKFIPTKMYGIILDQKKKFPEKIIIPIKSNPIDQEQFELMKTASFSSNSIPLASMKGNELQEACANIAKELREILENNKDRLCQLIDNSWDIPTAQQNTGLEIDPTSIVPNLSPDATKQQEMEKSLFIRKIKEKMTNEFKKKHSKVFIAHDSLSVYIFLRRIEELFASRIHDFHFINPNDSHFTIIVGKALTELYIAGCSLRDALEGESNSFPEEYGKIIGMLKSIDNARAELANKIGINPPEIFFVSFKENRLLSIGNIATEILGFIKSEVAKNSVTTDG